MLKRGRTFYLVSPSMEIPMTIHPNVIRHTQRLSSEFLVKYNIDAEFLYSIIEEVDCHVTVDNQFSVLMRIPSGSDSSRVVVLTKSVLEKYKEGVKSCPHCGKIGRISRAFGWRNCAGTIRPQSWCTVCRSL